MCICKYLIEYTTFKDNDGNTFNMHDHGNINR
jgi:hypothetical protein